MIEVYENYFIKKNKRFQHDLFVKFDKLMTS